MTCAYSQIKLRVNLGVNESAATETKQGRRANQPRMEPLSGKVRSTF